MALMVVGAGLMGRGIAYVAAADAEISVALVDSSGPALEAAIKYITGIAKRNDLDAESVASRVLTFTSIKDAMAALPSLEFVIEAVPEKFELKKSIFTELIRITRPEVVLATNTSSLPITKLAEAVGSGERIIGMHFFNPVPRVPGLEVIPSKYTDKTVIDKTVKLGKDLGRSVSLCSKDVAGFLVNRILNAQILEALHLLEIEAGTPADIDRIMRSAAGAPMGPFRVCDMVGLDTVLSVMLVIYEDSGRDQKYKPSIILENLVKGGKLGMKTGEGFYKYKPRTKL